MWIHKVDDNEEPFDIYKDVFIDIIIILVRIFVSIQ